MAEQNKPSFFSSTMSGIGGYFKGAIAGALVGAAALAAITGILALTPLATAGAIGIAAAWGAGIFGSVGAVAGATTGVVKSREVAQVDAQDVVNVANIAFAQGLVTGHEITAENPKAAALESKKFRELVDKQRAAAAEQTQQR